MIVMCSNRGLVCGYVAGKYDGRLAFLLTPGDTNRPEWFMPYALDNGAFSAWTTGQEWDEDAFYKHLDVFKSSKYHPPKWVAVPDVVTDREGTIERWHLHGPRIRSEYGWNLAFVVQDGMEVTDVPEDADLIFVGGSTEWKWRNLRMWTEAFPRVHVGRVGSERLLWMAHDAGAESVDSSGFFRGGRQRLACLLRYLEESTHGRRQSLMENVLGNA